MGNDGSVAGTRIHEVGCWRGTKLCRWYGWM